MTVQFRSFVTSLLVAAVLASGTASAATIQLRAWLSGQQEVPPAATSATGLATVTYDTATGQLSWNVAYSGLSSAINGAHFHGPTPAGFDANVTLTMSHGPSPIVGSATINATQAAQLLSGQWYMNLHSANFADGEIRGQVLVVRGDVNGDGRADVVWRDLATGDNYLYPMNGRAILASEGYLRRVANQGWQIAGIGDFDGDGRADILWRNFETGENYLYLMNGTLVVAEGYLRTVVSQNWQVAGVGDFNSDGRADILWRNSSSGETYVYLMNGVSIAGEGYLRTVADLHWRVGGVGDFNGDGRADILWRNSSTGENYVYLVNATSIAGEGYLRTVADQSWRVVGVADFDGDGRSDILWRNSSTGQNYMYPMAGLTILPTEGSIRTLANQSWQVEALGDYDGDGKSDILWRNAITGENYLYPMDGRTIKPSEGYIRTVADSGWKIAPSATKTPFPLRLEAGKRYLVDASGNPFFLHADTAWSLIASLSLADAEKYLEDRRKKGFNAVIVSLIEHFFTTNAPRNFNGDAPFTTPGNFGTPNEAYFSHADQIVQRAAAKGILVLLLPAYLGYAGGNEGWYQEMAANGPAAMRTYGRYVGQRHARFTNILWVLGGDFNPPSKALVRELALGIKEFDPSSLHSAHCAPETSALGYWAGESWLQVNNIYTYVDVPAKARTEYGNSMPFFLFESHYENDPQGTEQRVRVQAYQALLSGAMGHAFGNNPIWHFDGPGIYPSTPPNWEEWLDSAGARSMVHLRSLFTTRAWWTLVPDFSNAFLTNGHASSNPFARAVAAKAQDGSFAFVYMPSARAVTVDLAQMAGPRVLARWYDPASGQFSSVPIPGSPFPRTAGSQTLPLPPGNNSSPTGNFSDWVLVLESTL
jgi:hypothetical protein